MLNGEMRNALTMSAFSNDCTRDIRFMGSKGELYGRLEDNEIYIKDFIIGKTERIPIKTIAAGHGGGDSGIMKHFGEMIRNQSGKKILTKSDSEVILLAYQSYS